MFRVLCICLHIILCINKIEFIYIYELYFSFEALYKDLCEQYI